MQTLKFPPPTIVPALNHWSTDKETAFMNQYRWENNNKPAKKSAYFSVPLVQSTTLESLFAPLVDILNCLMDHLRVHRFHTASPMDINKYILVMVFMYSH